MEEEVDRYLKFQIYVKLAGSVGTCSSLPEFDGLEYILMEYQLSYYGKLRY